MAGFVESVVNAKLAEFLEENPAEGNAVIRKAVSAVAGPRRRAQGARPDAAQVGAGELRAAGQARRLLDPRPLADRALHRRGRLRRRLGQAGPRPLDPGGAAAARQDPQRREGAHRQGAAEPGDPGADHGARHRRARRVRPRELALPQDHPDDGRRRRRRAHPHADPDAAVPRDAGADRARLRLHRQAAAVTSSSRASASATSRSSPSSRRSCSATSSTASRSPTTRAPTFNLTETRWQRYCRLLKQYEGWASALRAEHGARHGDVPRGVADPRRADHDGRGRSRSCSGARTPRPSPTPPSCCRRRTASCASRRVERKTNLARTHRLRRTMFEANEYRQLARVHAELVKMAGTPPFTVVLGEQDEPRRCRSRTCAASSWRSRPRASRCSASRASAR